MRGGTHMAECSIDRYWRILVFPYLISCALFTVSDSLGLSAEGTKQCVS